MVRSSTGRFPPPRGRAMLRRGREEVKESWSAYRAKRPVLAFALSWKSGPFRAALGVGYGRGLYPPWSPLVVAPVKVSTGAKARTIRHAYAALKRRFSTKLPAASRCFRLRQVHR